MERKQKSDGTALLVGTLLVTLLVVLILSVNKAEASFNNAAKVKAHDHCWWHYHPHEDGSMWHHRKRKYSGFWEQMRFNAKKGEEDGDFSVWAEWAVSDGIKTSTKKKKKPHRHCFVHKHNHINAGFYHEKSGQWKSLRVK